MNKILKFFLIITLFAISCEKMEDTYSQYLEDTKIYSPRIKNLEAKTGLREVTLIWENPAGDVAKSIYIDFRDSTISTESMIDSILITGLEIKGYEFSVYTKDMFGNLSIPLTVTAFPNGENK